MAKLLKFFLAQGDKEFFTKEFDEYWRILKPGGLLCGSTPSRAMAWSDPAHRRSITKEVIESICAPTLPRPVEIWAANVSPTLFQSVFLTEEASEVQFCVRAIKHENVVSSAIRFFNQSQSSSDVKLSIPVLAENTRATWVEYLLAIQANASACNEYVNRYTDLSDASMIIETEETLLQFAAQLQPNCPIIAETLARFQMDTNGYNKAAHVHRRLIRAFHDNKELTQRHWLNLGISNLYMGQMDNTMRCFSTAVSVRPETAQVAYHSLAALFIGEMNGFKGSVLTSMELRVQRDVAVALQRIISENAGVKGNKVLSDLCHYSLGNTFHMMGLEVESLQVYQRFIHPSFLPRPVVAPEAAGGNGKLHIICMATEHRKELDQLTQSAEHAGVTVTVLGMGVKYTANAMKLDLFIEGAGKIPDNDYILAVDAYDVLLLPAIRDLIPGFKKFGTPILFSAEKGCFPDAGIAELFPKLEPGAPFRFLNSGSIMGKAKDMKRMLAEVQAYDTCYISDQVLSYRTRAFFMISI